MRKIILSADTTCDLPSELIEKHNIQIIPLYINLDGKEYRDSIDVKTDDIYAYYDKNKVLPKTSAPSIGDFISHFEKWPSDDYEIIHISLGSGISASYQNALLAANSLENVHVIDSRSLSCGSSLLLLKAKEMIDSNKSSVEIVSEIENLTSKTDISFVIDSLTYLREGGRLSALQAFGANLLNIKPCVKVDPSKNGKMDVASKYRGSISKIAPKYVKDKLNNIDNIDTSRLFIVHSGTDQENIELIKKTVESIVSFDEVIVARAGSTISSHCGANTIGLIYLQK